MISPVPNSIDFSNQKKVELTHKSLYLLNFIIKEGYNYYQFCIRNKALGAQCSHFMGKNSLLSQKSCIFATSTKAKSTMTTQQMFQTIADYFKTQPVKKAWIFGSFARGEETPLSDIDLLVTYEDNARVSLLKQASMINELESLLDRSVDIVPEKLLRNNFKKSVNQDKKLIYERAN